MPESVQRCTINQLLNEARSRIERFEPAQALAAAHRGATIIDIRADTDRLHNGIVPGSLHIPRTVLEWRLDPESEWRSPYISGLDHAIILLCDHGFSSSLAASTLLDLGFQHVGDVIGGFEGWRDAGLPVGVAPPPHPACELVGMRPVEGAMYSLAVLTPSSPRRNEGSRRRSRKAYAPFHRDVLPSAVIRPT